MGKAVFAVGVFETEVHAAGLVVTKGGAGRHFEVGFLARRPDFDVVGLGGAEANIAGAEFDDTVVEAEELEDFFGVASERFQSVHGGLRRGDVHEFDFVKLMHADESAGAEASAACLPAEAGGVSGVVDGKLVVFQDFLTVKIGDGYFGGGNEVEIVLGAVINLVAEFWELAGADEAFGFHEKGRTDLGITMLGGVEIEQEVDEGALESCASPTINHEGAAGDFGTRFKVDHAMGLAKRDMVFRFEVVRWCDSPAADFGVFFGGAANGAGFVRQIWEGQKEVTLLGVGGVGFRADLINALPDAAHFGFLGGGVLAVFATESDFFGEAVAITLQLLALSLGGAAGSIEGEDLIDQSGKRGIAGGETLFDEVGIFAQEADVEHSPGSVAGDGGLSRERWGVVMSNQWSVVSGQ